jgi:hypothetical protein
MNRLLCLVVLVSLFLVGCSNDSSNVAATVDMNATATQVVAPTFSPEPTIVPTPTMTASPTEIPIATETHTIVPTVTPSGPPQIYIGLHYSAINNNGCGGTGLVTMDYDPVEGVAKSYWDVHPEVPEPEGFTYRSHDGHRILDFCTYVGYPITFLMEEGRVIEDRFEEGIISILITEGVGCDLVLTAQHVNLDIDPSSPGVQYLENGTIVHQGDLIAYTDRFGILPGSDSATAVGVCTEHGCYHSDQEMMLIGPDGQPNILYE